MNIEKTLHKLLDLIFDIKKITCLSTNYGENVFRYDKFYIYYDPMHRNYRSAIELRTEIKKYIPISNIEIDEYVDSWAKKNDLWKNKIWG